MPPLRELAAEGPQGLPLQCCLLFLLPDWNSAHTFPRETSITWSSPCLAKLQRTSAIKSGQPERSPLPSPAPPFSEAPCSGVAPSLTSLHTSAEEPSVFRKPYPHIAPLSKCPGFLLCWEVAASWRPQNIPESPLLLGTHRTQWAEQESLLCVCYIEF